MINLHKIIYNFLDLTNWPPTPRTGPYDPSSSGGVVAEWVGALDWRPGGPGFESRSDNFASELWQFCLYPALPVSFRGDTKSSRSLLPGPGVYARGSKIFHQSALEMCNLSLTPPLI